MEGREKNAETQAGCQRHVLHRILAAASPKRNCDRLFKVTNPAAHTHLTRARCHGLLARSAATNICSMAAVLAHCSLLSSNPSFVARTRVLGLSSTTTMTTPHVVLKSAPEARPLRGKPCLGPSAEYCT